MAVLPTADYRLPTTGFTLIEVLVSIALVSTILLMVYGSFRAASRAMDLCSSRLACGDRTCLVLRLMARQLRCLYTPTAISDPTAAPLQSNTSTGPTATPALEPLDTEGDTLSFLTTAGPGPSSTLARVTYRHDASSGTLSFSSEPYVAGAGDRQDTQGARLLLEGVQSMEVQFFDGRQWQPQWADGPNATLPRGVKIALTVVDENNRPQEFETVVPIGCRTTPLTQPTGAPAVKL